MSRTRRARGGVAVAAAKPPASGILRDRDVRWHVLVLRGVEGGTQFFDRSRPFLTSLLSRPGLRLHEQRAQLVDQLYGGRTGVVELLDSLEPLEDRPRLVHEPKVAPLLSQMRNGFEPVS